MKKLGRKFWLFIITMLIVMILSFFDKDSTQVVTLFGVYCAGNVGSKLSLNVTKKEV